MRSEIECSREEILKIPSVILAESDKEMEAHQDLKEKLNKNV